VLTKARSKLSVFIYPFARRLRNINPNIITLIGLATSFICIPTALYVGPLATAIAIAISAYMDALDGAVARLRGQTTKFGAVLDSLCDRIEEIIYVLSLFLLGLNPVIAIVYLGLAYTVSYLRALGELRGVRMEGIGLFERAERIIFIVLLLIIQSVVPNINLGLTTMKIVDLGMIIASGLCLITALQRVLYIGKKLSFS